MVVAADQAAKDGILPDYALWCATMLAALLQEKDPLGRGVDAQSADVMLRLKLLQGGNVHGSAAAVQRIQTTQKDIVRRAGFQNTKLFVPSKAEMASAAYADVVGLLLAMAFPDRIAQRRESTDPQPERVSYRFAGARGGWLSGRDPLSQAPYIAVAACGAAATGHRGEGGIYMAAALEIEKIQTVMPWLLRTGAYVHWDAAGQQVKAEEATRIGALVLKSRKLPDPADEAIMEAWRDGVQQQGIAAIPWQKEHVALRQRMAFVHFQSYAVLGADTPWPDVSDAALLERLSEWFLPYIGGLRKWSQLAAVPWGEALKSLLPWDLQRQLDTYAPRHVVVPSGSKVPLDYSTPAAPALHVRLQEMFGACHTPCVGDVAHQQAMPAVPVVMHLLSPAQRPLQVTQNLESFWADGYSHVKAEMKGRYPRHYWPDNPLEAAPTRRSKASMDRQKK
jgi:ATP-dependent helicase HrpB